MGNRSRNYHQPRTNTTKAGNDSGPTNIRCFSIPFGRGWRLILAQPIFTGSPAQEERSHELSILIRSETSRVVQRRRWGRLATFEEGGDAAVPNKPASAEQSVGAAGSGQGLQAAVWPPEPAHEITQLMSFKGASISHVIPGIPAPVARHPRGDAVTTPQAAEAETRGGGGGSEMICVL